MNWSNLIGEVVITGLAAFGGAWAAFLFEGQREFNRRKNEDYCSLRLAHFVIMRQYSILENLKSVLPETQSEDSWWRIKPTELGFTVPLIDITTLSYLIDGSDADIIRSVLVGQNQFETVKYVVLMRNEQHELWQARVSDMQAKSVKIEPHNKSFQDMIGMNLIRGLHDSTSMLYKELKNALPLLKKNLDDIAACSTRHFPKRTTPQFISDLETKSSYGKII